MVIFKRIFFFILCCFAVEGHAQYQLSLEECIRICHENNLQVKQAGNNLESAEITLFQQKMAFLPSLNANLNVTKGIGTVPDNFTGQASQSPWLAQPTIGTSLTLFRGMANWNSMRSAELNVMASEYGVQATKDNLSLNVLSSFFMILMDQENLRVAENRIAVFEKQLERARARVSAGVAVEGDLLNLQSQIASEKLTLLNLQNQLQRDKVSLSLLLMVDPAAKLELEVPDLSTYTTTFTVPSPQLLYDFASVNRPALRQRELQVRAGEYSLKAVRSGSLPTLRFNFGVSSFYSSSPSDLIGVDNSVSPPRFIYADPDPLQTQLFDNKSASMSMSLSVPIFNNYSVRQNYLSNKISLDNTRLTWEQEKWQLYQTLVLACQDAEAAGKKYEAAAEQLEASSLNFEYASKREAAGLLDFFSFNEILNTRTSAELQLIQAKYEFIFKSKVLDLYSGKPLTF